MKIEVEIINTLNSLNVSNDKIRADLRKISEHRRGDNKKLIYIVSQMIDIFNLPLKYNEEININKNTLISERNYELLDKILLQSQHILFNAVCSEILWKHRHKKEYAEKAIINYYKLIDSNCDKDLHLRPYVNVCRVYSKINGINFNYRDFFDKALACIRGRFPIKNYCNLFVLTALSKCNLYTDEIVQNFYEIIDYYEKDHDYQRAANYLEELIEHKNLISSKDRNKIITRIAGNYEKEASKYNWSEPKSSHTIVHLIQTAMSWWNKSSSESAKSERKRLAKSIEPVKKLIPQNMQTFTSPPIDISDWIKNRKAFIDGNNIRGVILGLAEVIDLESPISITNEIKKSGEIFADFFGTNIIDKNGRIKFIVPSLSTDHNAQHLLLEFKAKQKYDDFTGFVHHYLNIAKEKFEFKDTDIDFLIRNNAFIPDDRTDTYKKGLIAGFNYDYATALHLLMPQVENSLRCIAENCGAVVYKTNDNGIEESLSLGSILDSTELCECLDETLLFNLRVFYTSPSAYGMRDEIAHSFFSDQELNSYLGLALWWFTLRLCCIFSPVYSKYYINKFHPEEDKRQTL